MCIKHELLLIGLFLDPASYYGTPPGNTTSSTANYDTTITTASCSIVYNIFYKNLFYFTLNRWRRGTIVPELFYVGDFFAVYIFQKRSDPLLVGTFFYQLKIPCPGHAALYITYWGGGPKIIS